MRHFVIGDVHGHVRALQTVLAESGHRFGVDRLILLGDYVDKGPQSGVTVAWIYELVRAAPAHVSAVLGNHDEWYVRYHRHLWRSYEDPSYAVPMSPKPEQSKTYRELTAFDDKLVNFLASRPRRHFFDVGDDRWVAVHAGVEPAAPESDERVLRIRYVDPSGKAKGLGENFAVPEGTRYWTELYDGERNVVYGHHVHSRERPVETWSRRGRRLLSVDTGCGYGGVLSCVCIETGEVWQSSPDGTFLGKTSVERR